MFRLLLLVQFFPVILLDVNTVNKGNKFNQNERGKTLQFFVGLRVSHLCQNTQKKSFGGRRLLPCG